MNYTYVDLYKYVEDIFREEFRTIGKYDIQKQVFCAVSVNQNIPAEAIAKRMLDLVD